MCVSLISKGSADQTSFPEVKVQNNGEKKWINLSQKTKERLVVTAKIVATALVVSALFASALYCLYCLMGGVAVGSIAGLAFLGAFVGGAQIGSSIGIMDARYREIWIYNHGENFKDTAKVIVWALGATALATAILGGGMLGTMACFGKL